MTEINKDEIAVVGVKIDENGNPIISVNPSTNGNLTTQQIEESKSIWSKLFEIFTYNNDLFEIFKKPEEVRIIYNTRYNDRIQENINQSSLFPAALSDLSLQYK